MIVGSQAPFRKRKGALSNGPDREALVRLRETRLRLRETRQYLGSNAREGGKRAFGVIIDRAIRIAQRIQGTVAMLWECLASS